MIVPKTHLAMNDTTKSPTWSRAPNNLTQPPSVRKPHRWNRINTFNISPLKHTSSAPRPLQSSKPASPVSTPAQMPNSHNDDINGRIDRFRATNLAEFTSGAPAFKTTHSVSSIRSGRSVRSRASARSAAIDVSSPKSFNGFKPLAQSDPVRPGSVCDHKETSPSKISLSELFTETITNSKTQHVSPYNHGPSRIPSPMQQSMPPKYEQGPSHCPSYNHGPSYNQVPPSTMQQSMPPDPVHCPPYNHGPYYNQGPSYAHAQVPNFDHGLNYRSGPNYAHNHIPTPSYGHVPVHGRDQGPDDHRYAEPPKAKVDQELNKPPLRSLGEVKTYDGEEPDWNNLSATQTEEYFTEYEARFKFLKKSNPQMNITIPKKRPEKLSVMVQAFNYESDKIVIHNMVGNWKSGLIIFYYIVEGLGRFWLKFEFMKGYGSYHVRRLYNQERALFELGERCNISSIKEEHPMVTLIKANLVNTGLFVGIGLACNEAKKKMKGGFVEKFTDSETILGLINRAFAEGGLKTDESGKYTVPVGNEGDMGGGLEYVMKKMFGFMDGDGLGDTFKSGMEGLAKMFTGEDAKTPAPKQSRTPKDTSKDTKTPKSRVSKKKSAASADVKPMVFT